MVRLLLCDDSAATRAVVRASLADCDDIDVVGEAANGEQGVARALELQPDAVLMDVDMPGLNGVSATRELRRLLPGARVVAFTARESTETVVSMINAGARAYVVKGATPAQLRQAIAPAGAGSYLDAKLVPGLFDRVVSLLHDHQQAATKLDLLSRGIVGALAAAVEARDGYTGRHVERVSELALHLAAHVSPELARDPHVEFGYLLHDVGKLGVRDTVLRKPGALDPDELVEMRAHVEIGVRLLEPIPDFEPVREIVLAHHERWDGTGYPPGLRGEETPIAARLFAVCDSWDAMTSDRPYRAALPESEAMAELLRGAGSQFDPRAVSAFIGLRERGAAAA